MADPATYRPAPSSIPTDPGVYKFRDEHGRVIYVGKAKNLRARLANYFQDLIQLHPRTRHMVTTAASVEWTVVSSEVEALHARRIGRRAFPACLRLPRTSTRRGEVFWPVFSCLGDQGNLGSTHSGFSDPNMFQGRV